MLPQIPQMQVSERQQEQITLLSLVVFCVAFELIDEGYQYLSNPTISRLWLHLYDSESLRRIMISNYYILILWWISVNVYTVEILSSEEFTDVLYAFSLAHMVAKLFFRSTSYRVLFVAPGTNSRKVLVLLLVFFWCAQIASTFLVTALAWHSTTLLLAVCYLAYDALNAAHSTTWMLLVFLYIYSNNLYKYSVVIDPRRASEPHESNVQTEESSIERFVIELESPPSENDHETSPSQ